MGDRVGATLSGSLEGVLRRWRALAGGTQAVLASLTVLSLAAAGGVLWVALFSSSGHDDEGALPLDESVTSAGGSRHDRWGGGGHHSDRGFKPHDGCVRRGDRGRAVRDRWGHDTGG